MLAENKNFSGGEQKMGELELKHHAHKVGVNVHHFEWCTKYRYKMLRQDKYKHLCEEILKETAKRHKTILKEVGVMPEHIHVSAEILPNKAQLPQHFRDTLYIRKLFILQKKLKFVYEAKSKD